MSMTQKRNSWAIVLAFLVIAVPGVLFARGAPEDGVINATFASSEVTRVWKSAEMFADYVEEHTNGGMIITVIPIPAIGSGRDVVEQLELGEIEFNMANSGALNVVFSPVEIYSWPFMFASRDSFWELMVDPEYTEYVKQELLNYTNNSVRFLGSSENSVRHFYSTRGPIRVPSDIEEHGLVVRTMELQMHQQLFSHIGAAGIEVIPSGERYAALQSGLIHATEGGAASARDAGIMEVQSHATLTSHMHDYLHWIVNENFYQSLPADFQKAVRDGALLAIRQSNSEAIAVEKQAFDDMRNMGVEVYEPTVEEIRQWQNATASVAREFIEREVPGDFIERTLSAIRRIEAGM